MVGQCLFGSINDFLFSTPVVGIRNNWLRIGHYQKSGPETDRKMESNSNIRSKATLQPIIIVVLGLVLFFSTTAFGLSDDDYRAYSRDSSNFRQAEEDLNLIWKRLMRGLTSRAGKALLQDQKLWVNHWRDDEAQKLAARHGLSRPEAYALATRERIGYLKSFFRRVGDLRIAGRYDSGMGYLDVAPPKQGRVTFTLSTDWPPQKCSGRIENKTVVLNGNTAVFSDSDCPKLVLIFEGDRVLVEEPEFCGHHGLNCRFDGKYVRSD